MKKSVVTYIHVISWTFYFGLLLLSAFTGKYLSAPRDPTALKLNYFFGHYHFMFSILYFYIGYFGIAKLIDKKRFPVYTTLAIVIIFSILFLISPKLISEFILIFCTMLFWITFGCFSNLIIDWFQNRNKILVLEKQNADSNLALLRTQINPHFLFNTLHNIDSLIMNNQEKASKSLIKLSDIMRYMLHESQSDFVPLKKELEHIQNYISLEELRIKNPEFLNFSVTGDYKDVKIAPMLFLPFIENAFKHSVDSDCENGISIEFVIDRNNITFKCRNLYDKTDTNRDTTHGIGLETVKQRLGLIYPDKHTLEINKNDSSFNVELKILVNEN